MATDMINPHDLGEKTPVTDLQSAMIGLAAARLIELGGSAETGAAYVENDPACLAQLNGYRD